MHAPVVTQWMDIRPGFEGCLALPKRPRARGPGLKWVPQGETQEDQCRRKRVRRAAA